MDGSFSVGHSWTNRDYQKCFIAVIFSFSLVYLAFYQWGPQIKMIWNVTQEKNKILKEVQQKVKQTTDALSSDDRSSYGADSGSNTTRKAPHTNGTDKISHNLYRLEHKTISAQPSRVINKKQDVKPTTNITQSESQQEARFHLRNRKNLNNISNNAEFTNTQTNAINDSTSLAVAQDGVNPSHYAPLPVAPPTPLTEAQKALARSRKLKQQQDLELERSIKEDGERRAQLQAESAAREAKHARIKSVKAEMANRAPSSQEDSIKLSFRICIPAIRSTTTSGSAAAALSSSVCTIQSGMVVVPASQTSAGTTSVKVTAVFAPTDTIEYVLDYVEGLEEVAALSVPDDDGVCVDLSLSYPTRVIRRSMDPLLTLRDVGVTTDSVVWVTFPEL